MVFSCCTFIYSSPRICGQNINFFSFTHYTLDLHLIQFFSQEIEARKLYISPKYGIIAWGIAFVLRYHGNIPAGM